MDGIRIRLVDGRLRMRYAALAHQHLQVATPVSTGPACLPGTGQAAACAQALWRFLGNDWSKLTYTGHTSKPDQVQVTHGHGRGV